MKYLLLRFRLNRYLHRAFTPEFHQRIKYKTKRNITFKIQPHQVQHTHNIQNDISRKIDCKRTKLTSQWNFPQSNEFYFESVL